MAKRSLLVSSFVLYRDVIVAQKSPYPIRQGKDGTKLSLDRYTFAIFCGEINRCGTSNILTCAYWPVKQQKSGSGLGCGMRGDGG